jgi:hypothetical protein
VSTWIALVVAEQKPSAGLPAEVQIAVGFEAKIVAGRQPSRSE